MMNMADRPSSLSATPQWPYLAAAAVLTDFSAEELQPLGNGKPDIIKTGAILMRHGEAITSGPAKGRWQLSDVSRRAVLSELKRKNQISEALHANPMPDNPTQRALRILLMGEPPDLKGKTLGDLIGIERAIDWLSPIFALEDDLRPKVLGQIERMRLLVPLQRLIADGFAGREDELRELRKYIDELPSKSIGEFLSRGWGNVLDVFRDRPPLVIHGPGGVGKSTLVAKFIMDHAGPDQPSPIPFIYLDFDRGQLDPWQPDTLLAEAFQQIRVQFPDFASFAADLKARMDSRFAGEEGVEISKSSHYDLSARLREEFATLLREIIERYDKNLLLFIDTFEVVQRRGSTAVFNVLTLAAELQSLTRRLRIVIAGRAALRDEDWGFAEKTPPWKSMPLGGFRDPAAGRIYLRARMRQVGVDRVNDSALDRIVSLVRGNPLSLRLAAQVFAREGLTGLEDTISQARFDAALMQERLQGMLHNRIVQHLPEKLRKIADPGLVMRRINLDVILKVLAEPCDLDIKELSEAEQLFAELEREVALVEPMGDGVLRHRPDVRVLMLPLLRKRLGGQARQIDQAAVQFWQQQNGADARGEELYHRLWLGEEAAELDACWNRGPVAKAGAEEALDEFEALDESPEVRIWLSRKLDRELSSDLETRADLITWERHVELQTRNLLSKGAAKEALRIMGSRQSRTAASPLWLLELEALKLLGRDDEALERVCQGLSSSHGAVIPLHIQTLLVQKAGLLERMDRLEESLDCISEAATLAESLDSEVLKFSTGIMRLRLLRKLGRDIEGEKLRQRLATKLGDQAIEAAITERPVLLREAAAELGTYEPKLFLKAAKRLGIESDTSEHEFEVLISLGVSQMNLGDMESAREIFEQSLAIAHKLDYPELLLTAINMLGNVHLFLGMGQAAINFYEESLRIAREIEDCQKERQILTSLAITYRILSEPETALEYDEQALMIAREIGDRTAEGNLLGNIGAADAQQGQIESAISALKESLKISQEVGDSSTEIRALGNLGLTHRRIGDQESAINFFQQQLDRMRHFVNPQGKRKSLLNMVRALADAGDDASALSKMHSTSDIFQATCAPAWEESDGWFAPNRADIVELFNDGLEGTNVSEAIQKLATTFQTSVDHLVKQKL